MHAQTQMNRAAFLQLSKGAHTPFCTEPLSDLCVERLCTFSADKRWHTATCCIYFLWWECVRQLTDIQIVLFEPMYLTLRLVDFSLDLELDASRR